MMLGQILVRKGLISSLQLEQMLAIQASHKRMLGELLVNAGLIQTSELEKALLEQKWREKGFWVID